MWGSSVGPAASVMSVRAGSDLEKSRPDAWRVPANRTAAAPAPAPANLFHEFDPFVTVNETVPTGVSNVGRGTL